MHPMSAVLRIGCGLKLREFTIHQNTFMKYQEFNLDQYSFRAVSVFHPHEKVWTSDFCEPYEWNSEDEMRMDMLIHYLAENEHEKISMKLWDIKDEDELIQKYNHLFYLENQ